MQKPNTYTDDRFWDCECLRNFIHLKDKILSSSFCKNCGAMQNDMPDSITDEVEKAGYYD